MSIAVFDIDGVVADVTHRLHYLEQRPKDWSRFFGTADRDGLLEPGRALVAELATEHDIVWLTGRPSWLRGLTADWLTDHDLPGAELHMRAGHDRRPARLYKLEVLRRLKSRGVSAFIDDDVEVIETALGAGFPAVLADWLPRTPSLRDAQERSGRS